MENPKVFISYSWHPEENKIRVQRLAERLMQDGVNVILDIWDLKHGHDKYVFMEQMVKDPDIKKVLVICNEDYALKADARKGGVGTESTIMSGDIYSLAEQTKFIPILMEWKNGEACLPTFLKSRMYIDMSSNETYELGYDQLLRDIYSKPLLRKPALGKMPSYLEADEPVLLSTAREQQKLKEKIDQSSDLQTWIARYCDKIIESLDQFKVTFSGGKTCDLIELVEKSISSMQVVNNDFIAFVDTVASNSECNGKQFVDFFEKLLQYYEDKDIELASSTDSWHLRNDNYRFFNYELFLSFTAIFQKHNYTLDYYKNKGYSSSSQVAILMNNYGGDKFASWVEVDILLYYLSLIYGKPGDRISMWYPTLSIYNRAFEILPKMASMRYFEKAKIMFGVADKDSFKTLIARTKDELQRDAYHRIPNLKEGLSYDKVCSLR
ncbi:hypothetical protein DXD25_00180 [Prevotella sp. TF12-30]|uniref:toll/interleukin-1 receptor domain-containing protein n=1 Tax=Prevotellaceae TaxID=171552 RepID=UPI000E439F96|nr:MULTISPECIES: toll/interleukin-1 receptor domain-containing protein [Prevotellaceae]RGK35842.1 hypothetical protein DXD25_00180 [Prevotella sp. TF12-30]